MKGDGSDVRRLTNGPGPTAARSSRGTASAIAFRGRQLGAGAELDDYRALLKEACGGRRRSSCS